jgi:hypothetical protein
MKKLIIASTILASTVAVSGGSSVQAAAANPASATVNCQNGTGNLSFAGQVGDTFEITNSYGGGACDIIGLAGKATPSGQGYSAGANDGYVMSNGQPATFTITGAGTFTLSSGGGALYNVSVVIGGGGPSGPATVVKGSFDPNGGECIFDGQKQTSKYNSFTVGFSYVPGVAECTRKGYVFTDWVVGSTSKSAGLPVLIQEPDMVKRHFVAQSGDYVAQWQKATASFDLAGGSCRIDGVVRAGWSDVLTDAQGKSLSTGDVVRLPAPEACSKDGARLVGWTSAITGDIVTASGATYVAQWVANNPTITITGYRTTVQGKPGICVSGSTTGIDAGKTVIPYFRFPGETTFTQGSARPEVRSDGTFEWCRKTGKKFYAYVTSADGSVSSNRVIIPAA